MRGEFIWVFEGGFSKDFRGGYRGFLRGKSQKVLKIIFNGNFPKFLKGKFSKGFLGKKIDIYNDTLRTPPLFSGKFPDMKGGS